jgi:hypothetical protein
MKNRWVLHLLQHCSKNILTRVSNDCHAVLINFTGNDAWKCVPHIVVKNKLSLQHNQIVHSYKLTWFIYIYIHMHLFELRFNWHDNLNIYIYLQLLDLGGTLHVDGKLKSTMARIHKIICSHVRPLALGIALFFLTQQLPKQQPARVYIPYERLQYITLNNRRNNLLHKAHTNCLHIKVAKQVCKAMEPRETRLVHHLSSTEQ